MAKGLTAAKAKKILEDGFIQGKALTEKQKKFFGAVAGGATPLKAIDGAGIDKAQLGTIFKLGKKMYQGAKEMYQGAKKFESSIDWRKWVKYTDDFDNNPDVIKHLNEIEETTKANGTWMKNPNGSAFNGTPEQFVIQQSDNFKKAFGESKLLNPDGSSTIQYHGTSKEFDTFDPNKFQLGDSGYSGLGIYTSPNKVVAKSYASSSSKFHTGEIKPTVMELYGLGRNPVRGHELPEGMDLFNFHRPRNYVGDVPIEQQLLDHDVAIRTQRGGIRIALDHDSYENVFPTNTQLKSAIGNILFDMNNPNIYKAIVPGAIGVGAASQMGPVQEDGQFKNGGWLDKFQNGGELNQKYIDSTFNANMDKRWVQRLYEKNPEFYLEGQTKPSTHYMESGDGYVYPRVMEGEDGQLKKVSREEGRSQGIKFPNDKVAQWFAKNYKKGTNVLKEYQMGGSLSGAWNGPVAQDGQRVADIATRWEMNEIDSGRPPLNIVENVKALFDPDGCVRDNTCVQAVKDIYSEAGINAIPGDVYNNRVFLKNYKQYGFTEITDEKNLQPGDIIQYYSRWDEKEAEKDPNYVDFPYHMGIYVSPGEYISDGDSSAPVQRKNMYYEYDSEGNKYDKDPFRIFRLTPPKKQMGGTIPGATGMMYARTSGTSPEEPKKAQDGGWLDKFQDGGSINIDQTANTLENMFGNVGQYFFDIKDEDLLKSPYKPTGENIREQYYTRPGMKTDVYKDLTSARVKEDYNHDGTFYDIHKALLSDGKDRKHNADNAFPKNKAGYKGQYNKGHGSLKGEFNLGRYRTDAGEDDKGKYISFVDVYDWNGMRTENAIPFYDRIYEKDWKTLENQFKEKERKAGEKIKRLSGLQGPKLQMGGSLPGASGMMYSRNSGSSAMSPPNLTKAQDGTVMYGTPEYKKAYEEGRLVKNLLTNEDVYNPLDEVVINSGVDYEKYPLYDKLSAQQKEYFNDPGPIGRGVRRAAQTDRGLAEDTYDVVNPLMYGMLGLAGGMVAGPGIATLGRAAAPYVSRYVLNPIQKALSYKPLGGPVSIGNTIDAGSAAYAAYATPEAYRQYQENPSFDTGLDLGLTAIDLVPFGEIFTGFKGTKNLYNKGKNLFTNDLKLNPNMYYRGIGQAGLDDITESGLLRAKPSDQIAPAMFGPFDMAKRFNNLYVTPRLGVAQRYGKGVVAEVPRDVANFSRRYTNSDWSMRTNNQIPIEEVNLYKKNFFGNYKPVNIPQPPLSSMPFSKPNIYPTSSPLPKNMEPYLSKKVYPFTKEQEIFESFLSTEAQLKNIDLKSIRYDADGNIIPNMEYGGDVPEAQGGVLLKFAKKFLNPIKIADKITPRPLAPGHLLGMDDSWNNYSPLNVIPWYGKKLIDKSSSYPNFVGFRKFGNSIDDVIESQSLRPNGSGMGANQIKGEGNWAEPGKVNENYSGVFEATMNPQIEGSNIQLDKWYKRNGIVGTTKEGDVAIPLTDAGLSFNRRLPFSNRYVPINKEKLINNEFQLSTQLPYVQSLAEKYAIWSGLGAGAAYTGFPQLNDANKEYIINPVFEEYKKINEKLEKFAEESKKQNSSTYWKGKKYSRQKMKQGGVIEDDRGQWAHPGEVTKINSNNITMKGVNYPVLGISDTGDTKMMQPGEDYKFKGNSVTEFPMARDGKSLVELNQLTNFTNYNTPQPGGWLDKYH